MIRENKEDVVVVVTSLLLYRGRQKDGLGWDKGERAWG